MASRLIPLLVHLSVTGVFVLIVNGCKCRKIGHGGWCDGEPPLPRAAMSCDPGDPHTGLRAELDRRLQPQWSQVLAKNDRPPAPSPGDPDPTFSQWSTSRIVEQLRLDEAPEEELVQACDAPDPIRQRIGGVAMLLENGTFKKPTGGATVAVLPSQPRSGPESLEVCPSETAGDAVELTYGLGTLFFIDRYHLVGAGHLLYDSLCNKPEEARLTGYQIAFGMTHAAITSQGTVEIPTKHLIDGSTVTVVECHGTQTRETEGDWVLLRTDKCICDAEPLPVRWNSPVAQDEVVHVLGHPNNLTMKYSQPPSKVGFTAPTIPLFRMDLVTDNGNSGSPIFDVDGNVVGIHSSRLKQECVWECTFESGGKCCRLARCFNEDCLLDGYATHIRWVEEAWKQSLEKVTWKGCESR